MPCAGCARVCRASTSRRPERPELESQQDARPLPAAPPPRVPVSAPRSRRITSRSRRLPSTFRSPAGRPLRTEPAGRSAPCPQPLAPRSTARGLDALGPRPICHAPQATPSRLSAGLQRPAAASGHCTTVLPSRTSGRCGDGSHWDPRLEQQEDSHAEGCLLSGIRHQARRMDGLSGESSSPPPTAGFLEPMETEEAAAKGRESTLHW